MTASETQSEKHKAMRHFVWAVFWPFVLITFFGGYVAGLALGFLVGTIWSATTGAAFPEALGTYTSLIALLIVAFYALAWSLKRVVGEAFGAYVFRFDASSEGTS
jgi:hypothetical protein